MRATEMHDLLREAQAELLKQPTWRPGQGKFANVQYCRYCCYSVAHGHGDNCLLMRLERATGSADAQR